MRIEDAALDARQRGACRVQLGQNIDAVAPGVDHRRNAANLTLDTTQSHQLGTVVARGARFGHDAAYPHGVSLHKHLGTIIRRGMIRPRRIIRLAAGALGSPVAALAQMSGMAMPPAATAPALHAASGSPAIPDVDRGAMAGMGHAGMAGMDHGSHAMPAALGPYPMTREASGTSWQPDAATHAGLHAAAAGWSLMAHGTLVLDFARTSGRRGDDKLFVAGHLMGVAARDLSPADRLQVRVALSPDPLMGPRGYPLLFAAGETADGRTQLIDRQHPHDLVSELSLSLSHRLSDTASVFVYGGVPGEPAFGPPAYVHRQSIMDDPEAPISHHWLDSTHISFGVVTAGVVLGRVKAEVSRYKGREPDQHRYDIETPKFDSTAARLSWNPSKRLALQASWTFLKSPEALAADDNQRRVSASALYTRAVGERGSWATTLAWGRRTEDGPHGGGPHLDAFVAETSLRPDARWTVFARAERIDTDELLPAPGEIHGAVFTVGKVSAGAVRDFRCLPHLKVGVGAVGSRNFVPAGLAATYGGDRWSSMAFVRLRLD